MRIGILTGGGDVPGLNPCIKAVVNRAEDAGMEVVGIRRGWGGLLNYNPDDPADRAEWVQPLTRADVRTIDRYGGTHLHTSRTNPAKVRRRHDARVPQGPLRARTARSRLADCTPHVLRALEHLGIDAMVPIGGDDTLSFAVRLHQEGVRVVAIPKTMDNDVFGTDYCIGFSTAVTRSVEFINALRTPTGSHERIAVVELFGRNSGETALISAYLADVDRALISEVPFDIERLAQAGGRGQAPQPQQLRDGGDLRRRVDAGRAGGRVRPGGCLRPPEARRDRPDHRRGAQAADRHRHRSPADRLPDARRRARLARPHGRRSPTPTWRSTSCCKGTAAAWSRCRTASTPPCRWTPAPRASSAWTSTSCTTSSSTGRKCAMCSGKPMFLY